MRAPYLNDGDVRVYAGDCVEVMAEMDAESVDAVVCDPPYGINFMGKEWDGPGGMLGQMAEGHEKRGALAYGGTHSRGYADNDALAFQSWCETWAHEALRVLKPGGHLLAFGGTRTYHRLTCAIEDAGFEIRDCIAYMFGSGFPKSRNFGGEWQGWGTALKPGFEPVVVARKPLVGTVAGNVLAHGTGALNIDGCRIGTDEDTSRARYVVGDTAAPFGKGAAMGGNGSPLGRWPANVALDSEAAALLDAQSGERMAGSSVRGNEPSPPAKHAYGEYRRVAFASHGDTGGASRFFYTAKASRADRGDGNTHPTVKPTDLMRWLVRLVTPPGGLVLDPFAGSGTTGVAARAEGFRAVLIEREDEYLQIISRRLSQLSLLGELA